MPSPFPGSPADGARSSVVVPRSAESRPPTPPELVATVAADARAVPMGSVAGSSDGPTSVVRRVPVCDRLDPQREVTVSALSGAADVGVPPNSIDDGVHVDSEPENSVSALNQSKPETTVDKNTCMFNEQNASNNKFDKNLKRLCEFEDEVEFKKIRHINHIDEGVSYSSTNMDNILKDQTVQTDSNFFDDIKLTESGLNNSNIEIENNLLHDNSDDDIDDDINDDSDDSSDSCKIISVSSDSYESDVSTLIESNFYSPVNDKPGHRFFDNTPKNFKNKYFKKYPQLYHYFQNKNQIFQEFEELCNNQSIVEKMMKMCNKKYTPMLNILLKKEKKWQKIYEVVFKRLDVTLSILKKCEEDMKHLNRVKPYVVKKNIGLQVQFYPEKVKNIHGQLNEHVVKVGENDFNFSEPSCSNSLEKKLLSLTNNPDPLLVGCTVNDTNIIDLTEDSDNEESTNINKPLSQITISLETNSSKELNHPVPLPSCLPNFKSKDSWKNAALSPILTVQQCPNSRNAIVLKWNLNINDDELAEIISYHIFCYQEIPSEKPSSDLWEKIAEIQALPLPMACSLSFESLKFGQKFYFAMKAIDKYLRVGPFSSVQSIELDQN